MTFMAPNVSALVGTEIGARLMAIAGMWDKQQINKENE